MHRFFNGLSIVALVGLPVPAAVAADQLAGQPALEKGIVEAEAKPEFLIPDLKWGDDQNWVEIYGQINKGVLYFDDGVDPLTFAIVDNANSSSRAGIRGSGKINEEWSVGANYEVEWNPYSTNNVNQLNIGEYDWDTWLLRKAEIYFTSDTVGKFWFGQGSMASDGTAEVDYSGTTVIGYSAVSDLAGGPLFRLDDGTLSDVAVKDAFSNFDGVGRKLRARYDTPSWEGFSLSASLGTQVVPTVTEVPVWDVAARYENEFGDFKVGGAVAFSVPGEEQSIIDGSFSALHVPSGLSLTVAGGMENNETATEGRYIYGKLGYQADLFEWGKSAISIDAYLGEDIDADGSDSHSIGAQFVQNIDYLQTEVYLGVRTYDYNEEAITFDEGVAVLSGARLKF